MAKSKSSKHVEGQSMMDVLPENHKEILDAALDYRKKMRARMAAGEKEVEAKTKLRDLVRESGATPLEDGKIRLLIEGVAITVKPRDELVQVKEIDDE